MHGDGSVPLKRLLDRRDLGLRAVVLPEGEPPSVRWAAVSELRDPAPYLIGGELVLTAGVNMSTAADDLEAYVSGLVRAGAGALGFGVTPVFDEVPPELVERCAAHGLALLEVARSTPFVAVGRAVGALVEEGRVEEVRRVSEAHRALVRSVTAAAPDERVLATLAGALGCWAVLLDGQGAGPRLTAASPPRALGAEVAELAERLRRPRGPRSAKAVLGGDEVFLHAVGEPPREQGVVVLGRPTPLDMAERAVLGTAVALLGLLSRGASAAVPGPLLCRLLLDGAGAPDLAPMVAPLAGRPPSPESGPADTAPDTFRVIHAVRAGRGPAPAPADAAAALGTELADPGTPGGEAPLRAIVADRADGAASRGEGHTEALDALYRRGWLGAMSRAVEVADLPEADREAAALLFRARAAARPLMAREREDPLEAAIDPAAAGRAATALLGPLAEETESAAMLRETLRAWLARNGNWDRTATDLGAHRNSVRYRVGRIERDLGIDLSDPEQRMRMWFAVTRMPGTGQG
ncbi:PucR family transcriptional regulator [Nocardiopsis sp. RSe5-2]|uniref:PucR family transcriptional regulator n=1 Tax=Nocardiopsis endophytica TaxID=3018445 RepID=A0ABT4U150_9ACTN|nr:PucR family transcriptional regulator [Nocardiopsis endophytica]MDA2810677.1 PucR family transcriptional regulator [Nocardiopsis endophytica]